MFRALLAGGTRVAYGARALTEGGLQSLPVLHFPGGALLGCAAGMVNVPKIKGSHNAMKSGMLAAEAAFAHLQTVPADQEISDDDAPADMSVYSDAFKSSWVYDELKAVRNIRPSFHTPLGLYGGLAYSALDTFILRGRAPWTFRTRVPDSAQTKPAAACKEIVYPPYEEGLSSDLLTALALTGTNHADDQPAHLRVRAAPTPAADGEADLDASASSPDPAHETASARTAHVATNVGAYAGLLGRACPAQVYEYVDGDGEGSWEGKRLVVNAQNCIHCKLCDIKVPGQDVQWTVPEGGGGPKYSECWFWCAVRRVLIGCVRSDHVGWAGVLCAYGTCAAARSWGGRLGYAYAQDVGWLVPFACRP